MDWDENRVVITVDGEVLNESDLNQAANPDGKNGFRQAHPRRPVVGDDEFPPRIPVAGSLNHPQSVTGSPNVLGCIRAVGGRTFGA